MRPSLFSQSLFALPLEAAIEVTAEIGFGAIELACSEPHFDAARARRAADPGGTPARSSPAMSSRDGIVPPRSRSGPIGAATREFVS